MASNSMFFGKSKRSWTSQPNRMSATQTYRHTATTCGALLVSLLLAGCSAKHYQKSADKQAYKIIQDKQQKVFGHTNAFSIETPYSNRKPSDIKAKEIIEDRLQGERQLFTISDALNTAVKKNRQYQLRKENLYLSALTLTRERHDFRPIFFANSSASGERSSAGEQSVRVASRAGVDQLFKTGGRLGIDIANDLLRFYTGDPRRSAVSSISANLLQPLLRGAGAQIAAESLTQAERNVIYETRSFSHYQNTFAVDIVSTYFRLLQQQDNVRNQYNNYLSLVRFREQAEALAVDRIAVIQADQARQNELRSKNNYIISIERYQSSLDSFKITLGLPLRYDVRLDTNALAEVEAIGLTPVPITESNGYQLALDHRLDFLNEVDVFEDSKRKIKVAANRLLPDLNLFADASLQSERPTDYAKFNLNDYRAGAGVQLNLPLDRLLERNAYRSALLSFERQIRNLSLFLDDMRDSVRQGLRSLEEARQSYEIQKNAKDLADRTVDSAETLFKAGRTEARDVLEARNERLSAYNAVTQALVNYHLTRLRLLLDMGVLKTEEDKFWLRTQSLAKGGEVLPVQAPVSQTPGDVIPPDKLFEK
jgi:outer membrane protein TolC